MKYRLTPLNIFCSFLFGLEILFFVFPESLKNEHYVYQHVYLIPVILTGLLIDYILQKVIKKYSLLLVVEIIFIATTVLLNIEF